MLHGKIYYLLSEEGRKNSLINGGNGKVLQEVEGEVAPKDLDIFNVDGQGNITMQVGFKADFMELSTLETADFEVKLNIGITINYEIDTRSPYRSPILETNKAIIYFDKIKSFEELIEYRRDMIEKLNKDKEEKQKYIREQEQSVHELKEKRKKETEKFHQEMIDWINKNGSLRLQLALEQGYEIETLYVTERAKIELEDYLVDTEGVAEVNETIENIPSERALQEVKELTEIGFNATVTYCISDPKNKEDEFLLDMENGYVIVVENIFNTSYSAYRKVY